MKKAYKIMTLVVWGLFFVSFLCTLSFWAYGKYSVYKNTKNFNAGIAYNILRTKNEGDIVAKSSTLKNSILQNDQFTTLSFLSQEKDKRNIGLMAVANSKGILTVRTISTIGRGVNIFLESPQGRAVSKGLTTASIEKNIFDPQQIFLVTARPIIEKSKTIGALFASENIDDTYIKNFKKEYLSSNTELAIYSKGIGLYSSTFQNEADKNLIRLFFNSNSDWIKNARSGDTLKLPDGSYYMLVNIPLQGIEETTAGAIIFIPVYPYLGKITLALFVAIIFFIILRRWIRKHISKRKAIVHALYLLCGMSLLIFFATLITQLWFEKIPHIQKPAFTIYNSTLRFEPDSGVLTRDFDQTMSVIIDTGGENINTVGVIIKFDPSQVTVDQINTESSFCGYFLEKKIDLLQGTITISCVVPSPGLIAPSANIANLVLTPKGAKGFELHFSPDTEVLANDGLGTNVLRTFTDASFSLEPLAITDKKNLSLSLYSPSHPNTNRWYNSSDLSFNWQEIPDYKYIYKLDKNKNDTISDTQFTSTDKNNVKLSVATDGIYYFHAASIHAGIRGPVSTYKVNVDTTPPQNIEIRTSSTHIVSGETVRLEFSGNDSMSGVLPNYYVKINDGGFLLPVKKELYVPFTSIGKNEVTLRLFDKAGNYTEKTITIMVSQ